MVAHSVASVAWFKICLANGTGVGLVPTPLLTPSHLLTILILVVWHYFRLGKHMQCDIYQTAARRWCFWAAKRRGNRTKRSPMKGITAILTVSVVLASVGAQARGPANPVKIFFRTQNDRVGQMLVTSATCGQNQQGNIVISSDPNGSGSIHGCAVALPPDRLHVDWGGDSTSILSSYCSGCQDNEYCGGGQPKAKDSTVLAPCLGP